MWFSLTMIKMKFHPKENHFSLAHGSDLERERRFQLCIPLVTLNLCFIFCDIKFVFQHAVAYVQKRSERKTKSNSHNLGFFALHICVLCVPE